MKLVIEIDMRHPSFGGDDVERAAEIARILRRLCNFVSGNMKDLRRGDVAIHDSQREVVGRMALTEKEAPK